MPFDYAPAPESRSIVDIESNYGLFIGGSFTEPTSGEFFKTINPATEEVLSEVAEAGQADVDAAVAAARRAYDKTWSKMSGKDRAKYIFRIARLIQERSRELAVLETLDNGKPIRESRDVDLPLVAAHFFYHAGWADKLEFAGYGPDPKSLGVAAQVIPWNFPLLMLAWKVAPALACGNTVVLKPAETTPLTALAFADICQQAGLPPGVVNIITGAGETGRMLVEHPDVDKVAFTGSTEVGKAIQRAVAGTKKKLTLELGGKAANIVFDDAPIDQAIEGIVNGIYFNQGHVCCAGSRLLLQESIADEALASLKRRLTTLRLGDPLDKNTDIGAINSSMQLSKIEELTAAGEAEGAERWSPTCPIPDKGFWFPPTLFTNVTQAHRIAREEIFGPVLSVLTFRTPEEAVAKANNTPFGLSAGIWTEKGSRIFMDGEPDARRDRLGQHLQQIRSREPLRRLQGVGLRPRGWSARFGCVPQRGGSVMSRVDVRKTHKLFIGGAFPRSESGRTYEVTDSKEQFLANMALASRKDARDAVLAARSAVAKWSAATAYNRGQVLYRIAEVMEGRREQFISEVSDSEGVSSRKAGAHVDAAIDRWVWYAGWADKYAQVIGNTNPVAGPFFNFSVPEPTGVVAAVAPQDASILGLVSVVAPIIVTGNAVIVMPSSSRPIPAIHPRRMLGHFRRPPQVW